MNIPTGWEYMRCEVREDKQYLVVLRRISDDERAGGLGPDWESALNEAIIAADQENRGVHRFGSGYRRTADMKANA